MSISICGGLFYGTNIEEEEVVEFKEYVIEKTLYDRFTGKPEQVGDKVYVYVLKRDIPEFGLKKDDIYLYEYTYITSKFKILSDIIREPFYLADDGVLAVSICETGYYDDPQDVFIEVEDFEDKLKTAIEKWNSVFPDIPGKLFSGMKYSY